MVVTDLHLSTQTLHHQIIGQVNTWIEKIKVSDLGVVQPETQGLIVKIDEHIVSSMQLSFDAAAVILVTGLILALFIKPNLE